MSYNPATIIDSSELDLWHKSSVWAENEFWYCNSFRQIIVDVWHRNSFGAEQEFWSCNSLKQFRVGSMADELCWSWTWVDPTTILDSSELNHWQKNSVGAEHEFWSCNNFRQFRIGTLTEELCWSWTGVLILQQFEKVQSWISGRGTLLELNRSSDLAILDS